MPESMHLTDPEYTPFCVSALRYGVTKLTNIVIDYNHQTICMEPRF